MKRVGLFLVGVLTMMCVGAVEIVSPVRIPVRLAGNFGEPRFNHFHQGIDVKTNQTVGHTVCSVADGYVSRISCGVGGFGLALYVTHPNGVTSVYCHLQAFCSDIRDLYFRKLHELRRQGGFVELRPDELPVSAGTPIALSGNTGASKGPHLHLEFHRTADSYLLDPLPYLKQFVDDNVAPLAHAAMICPVAGEGLVLGNACNKVVAVSTSPNAAPISAWGKIGVAIWANDYTSSTYNQLGVRDVRLFVDGKELYHSDFSEFSPFNTRVVNSWVVNPYFMNTGRAYLKSFRDEGNCLSVIEADNDGFVTVDQERIYRFEYVLTDVSGNVSHYYLNVKGVPYPIASSVMCKPVCNGCERTVQIPGAELLMPKGTIPETKRITIARCVANGKMRYSFAGYDMPLFGWARMRVAIPDYDNSLKGKYCIVNHTWKKRYLQSESNDGYVEARLRELDGSFVVEVDTVAPVVKRFAVAGKGRSAVLLCYIEDSQTGLKSFRGFLNGQFAVFHYEPKYSRLVCELRHERSLRTDNKLVLEVSDQCGNSRTYTHTFTF